MPSQPAPSHQPVPISSSGLVSPRDAFRGCIRANVRSGELSRRRSRLRAARRRQDGDRLPRRAERPGRALDGLHPRCRAGVRGHCRGPEPGRRLHLDPEHRCRGHRRHCGPRSRRHRSHRGDARDGGQGGAVQAVRWRGRDPDLPGDERRRRDRRDGGPARAELRWDQPRGHLRAPLLRDRGAAQAPPRHPGLPRRPARYRRGHARCAGERAAPDRPADGDHPRGRLGRRGRRASQSPGSCSQPVCAT